MGLASKLAAAQAAGASATPGYGSAPPAQNQNPYGAPPPQQNQYGAPPQQQYGQPPQGQGQYGQPHQQQYGQPPQGQYGAPPQQQGQGQYGQPPIPGNRPGQPQQSQYAPPGGAPPPPSSQRPGQQGQYGAPQGQGQYGQQQPGQYNQPPGGYGQPPQQQQGSYGGYGAPPPPSYGQSGQQQGAYPGQQQQQQQYGAPPQGAAAGGGGDVGNVLNALRQCVQDQNLSAFYPPGSLEPIAQRVASSGALQRLCSEWRLPMEIAHDLVKLSLFDTILYLDDSGSMQFEEGGSRIDDLKLIVSRVSMAASLFDQDGIQVRFMNSRVDGNNISNEQQVQQLLSQVRFSGLTPLGTSLDAKILQPLVLGPARAGQLQKPVLIIAVTDGIPGGEDRYKIVQVITNANRALAQTRYGPDAVSFQFAQVGNDQKARAFLEELDKHPEIGGLIDTTSNFENEADDMLKARPPVDLTPELWLVKLLMGGIDSSYDTQDE